MKYASYIVASLLSILILVHFVLLICGYKALIVLSGSMEPDIKTGSVIYVKTYKTDEVFDNIKVGDYITFVNNEGINVTHEVIYLNEESDQIQTQGIKENAAPDEVISSSKFVGKFVFTISYLGYIFNIIGSKYFIITFIAFILVYVFSNMLIKELRKEKSLKK